MNIERKEEGNKAFQLGVWEKPTEDMLVMLGLVTCKQ
jgi:hypothetical protein